MNIRKDGIMASWDETKLNELRAKYGESHGGELFDARFRKVADKIFSKSGTRLALYARRCGQ